jgi:PAS domain S-box-containing protein
MRYRSLLELAPFPAVLTRVRDGILLYGNHRAEIQYGISRENGIGQPAERFYEDSSQRERFLEPLQKTGKVNDLEVRMRTADGHPFWALVSAAIVEFENEPAIFTAINDITERKQMEDEIRQLNAELEERVRLRTAELANANKELETFTYSVSHDLKAPLRGIDGYSRLLLEDYRERLDQAGILLVNNVRNGVAQMSQLIEDLLAYSRMERRSLLGQTLDLSQVVARVLGEMRAEIQQHGMVVDMSLQGLTVRADPEGLAVVLRNLVDNAVKFSRDSHPPTLSITGVANEKSTTLIVRDNGIGFDMQFHNRIFEIFQRLQRAEEYPGTGVGLAIVHKAVQRMGGDIRAESVPGQGATFYLELPR